MENTKKVTVSDWIVIIMGIATLITTMFATEIKDKIMELFTKWQIIILFLSAGILIWRVIHIYVRNKLQALENKFNEIHSGQDKSNKVITDALMTSQEELFMMKTLMQIRYDNPDSFKISPSMKILDGINSDVPKLYNYLIKKEVWGNKYTNSKILEKMSRFFNRPIT